MRILPMRKLINAWHHLRAWRRRGELASGLDDEIQFHLDQQTEKNQRAGMPVANARRAALIQFSGVDATKSPRATSSACPLWMTRSGTFVTRSARFDGRRDLPAPPS